MQNLYYLQSKNYPKRTSSCLVKRCTGGPLKFLLISVQRRLQSFLYKDFFDSHFYQIKESNQIVGYIWITSVNNYRTPFIGKIYYELTLIININHRNKGYGAQAINDICLLHPNLVALVRYENLISNNLFKKYSAEGGYSIKKYFRILGSKYKKISN